MTPKEAPQKILELLDRVAHLELVTGVSGRWMSPGEAATILPLNRERIIEEIKVAEQKRAARKDHDLKYGIHYFNTNDAGEKSCWKIHSIEFWNVVRKPSEERS